MILSYKYKFFFLRSRKVAGSSILYALGKHCGDKDIVNSPDTAIARSNRIYGTNYESIKKNFHIIDPEFARGEPVNPRIHITPSELAVAFPNEWKTYFKIGAVRNPYDMVYSMWAFEQVIHPDRPFRNFNEWVLRKRGRMLKEETAIEFWFDHFTGLPIQYDFMIKYENLEEDYKKVCEAFKITYEPLIKLNTSTRLDREGLTKYEDLYDVDKDVVVNAGGSPVSSYRKHYDNKSKEIVDNLYGKVIEKYNYEF